MKFSMCFFGLISINILPKTYLLRPRKVPGGISCGYFSALEEICSEPTVDASELPKEATSIFYNGIAANFTLDVTFGSAKRRNDEHLKSMLRTGKQVFVLYYHEGDDQLLAKISKNSQDGGQNAKTEMASLKKLLEPYKDIAGLTVYGLSHSANHTTTACLTENFKIYIDEMRSCFPNYGIGFSMDGRYLSDLFNATEPPVWFDLSILDPYFDFYVVEIYALNLCTKEFKDVSSPINGSAPHTMEKVIGLLKKLGIPKKKTHFIFAAAYGRSVDDNQSTCDVTNAHICLKPSTRYCPETTQLFYDKGAFAKQYGAGFIVFDVDLDDDPHGSCQCNPYPGFHAILAGFNDDSVPPVCPLLEGQ